MTTQIPNRITRRLIAAEGYLELGLPLRAHLELDAVDGHVPVRKYVECLRGQACVAEGRYADAIVHLEFAAKRIPAPFNQSVWQSLGICYRAEGADELAEAAESMASQSFNITVQLLPPTDRDDFGR